MNGYRQVGYINDAFDLFSVDHLDQVRAARSSCDFLIVGVLADDLVLRTTGRAPVVPYDERLAIARAMRSVDVALGQMSDDLLEVWHQLRFDRLFVWRMAAVAPSHARLRQMGVDVVALTPHRADAGGAADPLRPAVHAAGPTARRA